jgi:hypothetical protein
MRMYVGVEAQFHAILTSALDGGLGRFIPHDRAPATLWIRGCIGPRVGMDRIWERERSLTLAGNRFFGFEVY